MGLDYLYIRELQWCNIKYCVLYMKIWIQEVNNRSFSIIYIFYELSKWCWEKPFQISDTDITEMYCETARL